MGVFGHQQSPKNLLSMARALYGHAPPAILFHVGAADLGFHRGLSRAVRRVIPRVVKEVADTVKLATQGPENHHA